VAFLSSSNQMLGQYLKISWQPSLMLFNLSFTIILPFDAM